MSAAKRVATKTETVSIRLPQNYADYIHREADKLGVSVSDMIRICIRKTMRGAGVPTRRPGETRGRRPNM